MGDAARGKLERRMVSKLIGVFESVRYVELAQGRWRCEDRNVQG